MLSEKLYELRKQRDLSQKELAALLGVTNKAVSKWETGAALPKTETLLKMADIFGVSRQELLEDAQPTPVQEPIPLLTLSALQMQTTHLAPSAPKTSTASSVIFTRKSAVVYLCVSSVLFLALWLMWGHLMSMLLEPLYAWSITLIPTAMFVGLFTGVFYLVRLWHRLSPVVIIVGAILFSMVIMVLWLGGTVMIIPSICQSVKALCTKPHKETSNGSE